MISVNPKRIKEPQLVTRGLLLHKAGDYSAAMGCYAKVLTKHPKHAVALYLMGLLFEAVNEQHRALDLLTQSVRIKPNFTEAWFNIGVVQQWLGKYTDARQSYERALKLDPRFAPAYTNLGNVLLALGEHDAAIRSYDRCVELRPDTVEGINNRSFVHLLRGNWADGWRDYESRWQLPGHAAANPMPPGVPWWNGEPLDGKRICLVHEQGVGDTLMMLRYVAGLQFAGATVILRVPKALERLCRLSFPTCIVDAHDAVGTIGGQAPWLPCDYVLPFMSLPRLFATTPDTVPLRETPYLIAPLDGPEVPLTGGFRVAFAWKGSKDHKNDRNRSTSLAQWLPLLTIPGVTWYSVQREMSKPEEQLLRQLPNVHIVNGIRDWADTASVLTRVEAFITVDTGTAHMAGALAVPQPDGRREPMPTCVLVSATPDFRWMLSRTDTVWYKNMKIFRQPVIGNWETPIKQIGAALQAIVRDHESQRVVQPTAEAA